MVHIKVYSSKGICPHKDRKPTPRNNRRQGFLSFHKSSFGVPEMPSEGNRGEKMAQSDTFETH